MIRPIEPKDLPKLKELAEWEFGPDYMTGLVVVDSQDTPIAFAGAWLRAEVHLAIDKDFATPGARMAAIKQLHSAMEQQLYVLGARQAITWLGDSVQSFGRRLVALGWVKSSLQSWHRSIR